MRCISNSTELFFNCFKTLRTITNGDISPPHIISSNPSVEDTPNAVYRSKSLDFDKSSGPSPHFGNASCTTSPLVSPTGGSKLGNSLSPLTILSCPYASSPYLEKYDHADSTSSYSPELRAKLMNVIAIEENSCVPFKRNLQGEPKWQLGSVNLESGKKLKILISNDVISANEAVIPFVGKFQLPAGFTPLKYVNMSVYIFSIYVCFVFSILVCCLMNGFMHL